MKNCPECGKPIGYGSTDCCKNCGADLRKYNLSPTDSSNTQSSNCANAEPRRTKICSKCHKTIDYDEQFCKYCGAKFYTVSADATPPSSTGTTKSMYNSNTGSLSNGNYSNNSAAPSSTSSKSASPPPSNNTNSPYNSNYTNNSNQSSFSSLKDELVNELVKTSPWIASLRTIFKTMFWLLLILSLVLGAYLGDAFESGIIGIIIVVLGIVLDLTIVGFQLVFLDLAEDIRAIKVMLSNQNKK